MQDGALKVPPEPEQPASCPAISSHEVEAELEKILASPAFCRAPRHSRFLEFVVRKTVAGSADCVKESLIGVEVFGRPPGYDPGAEPAVRVEAGRLRARLADYYEGLGKWDPIHIDLPRGTYVPVFSRNGVVRPSEETEPETSLPAPAAEKPVVRKGPPWWLAIAAVVAVASSAAVYFVTRKPARLGERDIVVLADFANRTADPVFDDTLKTALSVALRQSPFLNLLSDNRVASTLQLMARPANTALTPDVAHEVCERANGKAYIAGSIAALGNSYVLGLKAVNCVTGDLLAQEQVTATAKEKVLDSLGQAASKLRGQLGESLTTVRRYDVPLEQATTPSLDALKEYTLGKEVLKTKGYAASVSHFQRAIQLDPSFAIALNAVGGYHSALAEPEKGSEYMTKAFLLRGHASERERLEITASYYQSVTGERDKAEDALLEIIESYPRSWETYGSLAVQEASLGRYDGALEESRQAEPLDPDSMWPYVEDGFCLLALDRFDKALEIIQQAKAKGFDDFLLHTQLYALAFLSADSKAMMEQQRWYVGRAAYENLGFALASDTEAYSGNLQRAESLAKQAVDSAIRADSKESGAIWEENTAVGEAASGNAKQARRLAAAGLKSVPGSQGVELEAALTFAMAGDPARAEALAKDLDERFPLDTQVQSLWLPAVRAQIALDHKDTSEARDQLKSVTSPLEYGQIMFVNNISCLYPTYIHGQVFLAAKQGEAAATEFQKILDHSGIVWNCWTGSLAHLGLARAYALEARALQGAEADAARARSLAAYKDFLTLWNDADPDIPVLKQAKAEFARLQ